MTTENTNTPTGTPAGSEQQKPTATRWRQEYSAEHGMTWIEEPYKQPVSGGEEKPKDDGEEKPKDAEEQGQADAEEQQVEQDEQAIEPVELAIPDFIEGANVEDVQGYFDAGLPTW